MPLRNRSDHPGKASPVSRLRCWPALFLPGLALLLLFWIRSRDDVPFQQRNLHTLAVVVVTLVLLGGWWLAFSGVRWRLRITVALVTLAGLLLFAATFRIRGVTGDLVPILEPRWTSRNTLSEAKPAGTATNLAPIGTTARPDFPQFLGPDRSGILSSPVLDPDWSGRPPQILWRREVGAAWSGCAIVGHRVLTQEQRGDEETVTCYQTTDGQLVWSHRDQARYATTLAGEGPRATPTVVGNRVFTLGATGLLNCLALETGRLLWTRNLVEEAQTRPPEWGYSGSPLVVGEKVIVSAGGSSGRSLLAFDVQTGQRAWAAGSEPAGYSSPTLATLAGLPQILVFNATRITSHRIADGGGLWEYPWGVGHPHVSTPVVVTPHRVLFSSGYGVGAELLQVQAQPQGGLSAQRVWHSRRLKAKFANLVARNGFIYGLDDGILTCLDLQDGTQRWKEGRYGHGQALLANDLLLLMSEPGELVLLRPSPDAPNELHRFRVFSRKTWNPLALAGDLLLVRNDQEAAALRLPTLPHALADDPRAPAPGPPPFP